jgi:hypothetical protein
MGMSKRLQVLLPEDQFEEIRRLAQVEGVTVAAWVRRVLRDACREKPYDTVQAKLAAVREAATYNFPTCDLDQMLSEIAAGYDQPAEENEDA